MSNCNDLVCGTGDGTWTGPVPGDPDLTNIYLTAVAQLGGVGIRWTYPHINGHAVAHTIIYKGRSASFNGASQLAIASGNYYYDADPDKDPYQWYYWIKVISVNGTEGELIGPASATALSSISQIIQDLTGQIDAGLLAQELKKEIDRIQLIDMNLINEAAARLTDNAALMQALADVDAGIAQAQNFIMEESFQRTTSNSALASRITLMASALDSGLASVTDLVNTSVTNIEDVLIVQANKITQVSSKLGDDLATATTLLETSITKTDGRVDAVGKRIDQVVLDVDGAISASELSLTNRIKKTESAIELSAEIKQGLELAEGSNIVQAAAKMTGILNVVDGKVTQIGALYTMKLSVNGLIGGFGVYNDGKTVEAGFDVDTFWVGKTNANRKKPFIITNGKVYIDSAFISTLTADQIDTRGLTIKDGAGNIIFGAGTNMDWGRISGTGKPQNGATVGAPYGTLINGVSVENVTASVAASSALLSDMSSDSVLTPLEKSALLKEWMTLVGDVEQLTATSDKYPVLYSKKTACWNALQALTTYLNNNSAIGINKNSPPAFINDLGRTISTSINATVFRSNWTTAYSAYLTLLTAVTDEAAKSADWNNVSGTNKPENGATKGASIGTNVKFPNGETMGTADFVHRLSKIDKNNISTFMEGAAIGNAYIGNAAVETLNIGSNAVTVPVVDSRSDIVTGNGSDVEVVKASITLKQPGWAYAIFTADQSYGSGMESSTATLQGPNGSAVTVGGAAVTTNIAVSNAMYLGAGTHTFSVVWYGASSGVRIGQRTLFVMGAMR